MVFPVWALIFLVGFFNFSMDWLPGRIAERLDQLINYQEEGSAVSRFFTWEACFRVGMANPFLGKGFSFYSPHAFEAVFPEFVEKYGYVTKTCHNMWVTVFAEHGIATFIVWVLLLFLTLLSTRKISKKIRLLPERQWLENFSYMISGALLVFMVSGTFLDFSYFDVYYQLIAVVVLLKVLLEKKATQVVRS